MERFRDICENPPELQSCAVSYKEMSTFWLILAQAGGLPATSVSSTGDCEMMGVVILHEVSLEWKGIPRDSPCFSHKPLLELSISLYVLRSYLYFPAGTTSWLSEFYRFPDYAVGFCLQKMHRVRLRSSLPPPPNPAWRLCRPPGHGCAQHQRPPQGLLFSDNRKRQL